MFLALDSLWTKLVVFIGIAVEFNGEVRRLVIVDVLEVVVVGKITRILINILMNQISN